jgi:protein-tyrosine phosphatase
MGNICRSPLAASVFRALVREAGLEERFDIDSAGTSGYHIGEGPDPRTIRVAKRRGVVVDSAARRVSERDLRTFDYVIAMDLENVAKLRALAAKAGLEPNLVLLREFEPNAPAGAEVPDPYFSGTRGFEEVHDIIERACRGLLEHIRATELR